VQWYKEYKAYGDLHKEITRTEKYTEAQKQAALRHYESHGRCASLTIKDLGYPSKTLFKIWLNEAFPDRKKRCVSSRAMIECPQETKEQAVVALCARVGTAKDVAKAYGVSTVSLYKWKKQLFGEEHGVVMPKKVCPIPENEAELKREIEDLRAEETALQAKLYRLRLEYDILEKASEVLKKAEGINLQTINNREKAEVIDALRDKYRLKELLEALQISKSSYCYQEKCIHGPDKYADLRAQIQIVFSSSKGCYGYRRVHELLRRGGTVVSEKVVRRLMKEESLAVRRTKRRKFSSYVGEVTPAVENIVNRNFHADAPNTKWLTDITEFSIPAGKVYLSPIIDCFDGLAVSWAIGTSPSADLANSMLDEAISLLKEDEHPIVHSDRGGHYRWPGWIQRMDAAGLTRSMSKKGCSPDNSACEGFFGRLKTEMFYGRSWKDTTIDEFIAILNDYIHWYNECRIKESLGWLSPLEYRRSLGFYCFDAD
jgi:transposase InsO family protein/transposase-like protein